MRLKATPLSLAVGAALMTLPALGALAAEVTLPPVSVGAGVRTSFTSTEVDPPGPASTEAADFTLDSARIYISGKVTDQIGIMFNTEYNGTSVDVIDAVAQFSFSSGFNIWAGRFLPTSDRSNHYGPYYASHWGIYKDGVQDGYPFKTTGRDDGIAYWGDFGGLKLSAGVFDVPSTMGSNDVLAAARVQYDFWDTEAGYYLNGTYYGEKDLLAVGVAAQNAAGENAYTLDFLLEKKLGGAGVVTLEAEYAKYDGLGGYVGGTKSDGWYVLGAYLFPAEVGIGKFQVLGKFGTTTYEDNTVPLTAADVDHDTIELNVNYLIKAFNARISLFYIDVDVGASGPTTTETTQYGLGLQVQM
jgi:hypothetical protein